ncbi:SagB/ThcOx family dehydrogenase, partial [Geminicoccus harenae]|uniref:SagB/ThcOx family dehydrogenase n=1 Tax=Geminicoccus harenae TaxID=2498453 RepID=UPI001C95D2E4
AALPAPGQPHSKTLHAFVVPEEAAGSGLDKAIQILERPGRRQLDGRPRVSLGDRSPSAEFARRRSVRSFADTPVPRGALDGLLGRLAGEEGGLVRHRYPSAGSLYPVQAHLLVKPGRVDGIEGGAYYHDPVDHALVRLAPDLPPLGTGHPPTARSLDEAAFLLLLVADLAVLRPTYGDAARDFCLLEAGYLGQLLMTDLPDTLGLLPVGGLQVAGLAETLALHGDQVLVHALAGGVPDAASRHGSLAADLQRHLARHLPDYMVPRRITLLPSLPLSANGKVDRQALRPPAEPLPAAASAETEVVRALVGEILGSNAIGDHANLFDLGATSLHLVRLQCRLAEQRGGRAPAVVDLFRLPTVADIARHLAEAPASAAVADGNARAQRRLEARRRALPQDRQAR